MTPWISKKQISIIESYLEDKDVMLEYGSGGSTLHFSKFVKKYVSIEHDIYWLESVKKLIPTNVELHYCPPNNPIKLPVWKGNEEDFKDYINCVDKLNLKYDVVLVDGRCRKSCSLKVLKYLNESSIVFIHDFFERKRYHGILDYYEVIEKDMGGKEIIGGMKGAASLAILKKK